jgi:hypothetical protein
LTPLQVASLALVLAAVFDWFATADLVRAARKLNEPALSERAIASCVLTVIATGIAVLAGAYLLEVRLPSIITTVLLVGGLLAVSIPQLVWWVAFRQGRFK